MRDEEIYIEPKTLRGRLVKIVWGSLPWLFLIVLIIAAIVQCNKINNEKKRLIEKKKAEITYKRPSVNVIVQQVIPQTIKDRINLPGMVDPWLSLQVLSEIHGKVIEVPIKEGDNIAKGDVIAKIDSRDYQIALDSAIASHALAVADRKRARSLFKKGRIAKAELDSAETKVLTLKAAMENAELKLERCTIKAPISGVINRLDAKVGLLMNLSDPIVEILQIDRVKVAVGIPESDVNAVRKLSSVDLTIEALGNKTVTGKKSFLASAPDSFAHLYKLELAVDNPNEEILPGMFARAEIVKEEAPNSIAIPLYAVISRDKDQFVYVEKDGKAEVRNVKLGILDGWQIQILQGLKPGDRVIIVGHRSVDNGQPVNVVRSVTNPEELTQ